MKKLTIVEFNVIKPTVSQKKHLRIGNLYVAPANFFLSLNYFQQHAGAIAIFEWAVNMPRIQNDIQ